MHSGKRRLARDQEREARDQVEAAIVHDLPSQLGPSPTPRTGLQPRQLRPHPHPRARGRAVVPDHAAGEGRQARREGDRTRALRNLPDGGGGGTARAVRPHLGADRKATSARPSPMLTRGVTAGQPGVELRPECVLGVPQSGRTALGGVPDPPWRASRRQNTLACEVTRAVSKTRDGDGPRPSGECPFKPRPRSLRVAAWPKHLEDGSNNDDTQGRSSYTACTLSA
jgi:hypothetical protein